MYRTVYTELWSDPAIKSLDVSTRYLFLYLITNPHTHVSGIYYLPIETLLKETGLKQIPYRYGIDTLSKLEKAYRDDQTEVFFVTNMFQYQGQGPKNEAAAARHLRTLHHSSLIQKFLLRYPQIRPLMNGYPIDTLSAVGPSVPVPSSSSLSSPEGEKIGKKRGNGHRPFPEGFQIEEKHRALAASWHLDVGYEFGKFKNYCLAHNKQYADYTAAFRNWLSNAYERQKAGPR